MILVCDLSPADMAELMIAGAEFSGQHPEMLPVVTGAEFGALAAKAIPGAKKLVEG